MVGQFLILDDNRAEREIMARIIREAFPDGKISLASDATAAQEMCASQSFDCLVIDYNLPGMDGLSFAEKVRESHPYLAVVLVTSVGDEMLAARALRSGISDYIPKSRINTDSIHRTVTRAIHISGQSRVIAEQREELQNFAYALAHDFKQPIRQIRTFSQLITAEVGAKNFDEVNKHLGYMSEAARRLGDLVDVMSQYTLLSKAPEMGPVDLAKAVEGVRVSISAYLAERKAQLRVGATAIIEGNETLMAQVFQNLITNGVKYNRQETPCIQIGARVKEGRCLITVIDNGIGIDRQYLDAIFKPLVRLHAGAEYPGTGLGLTLARKAVIVQGGRIWCESEPGAGSTFFIDLPAVKPDRTAGAV